MNFKQLLVIICMFWLLFAVRSICAPRDAVAETAAAGGHAESAVRDCMNRQGLEEQMLLAINRARSSARRCGPLRCSKAGPVAWNRRLALAAHIHSVDMAIHKRFSHRGSDNSVMGDRLKAAGYRPRAWGENLAVGQRSVDSAVRAWVRSPAHCANIMLPDFTEIGASCVMDGNGRKYWTLMLAAPFYSKMHF